MARTLEIYDDGSLYEIEGDQAIRVTETEGEINALIDALQFTLATKFTIAPPDKQPPDIAEPRGSRQINKEGLKLLTKFEGCELAAYDDGGGVWTIGYGHIKGVKEGMKITQVQAEQMLQEDLGKYESFVEDAVKVTIINNNQFSALTCFCFNVGPGKEGFGGSTLLKMLNQSNFQGAANEFQRWNKVKGQSWLGLTRRRLAEKALFLGQAWEPFLNYEETTVRTLKLAESMMQGEDVRRLQEALKKVGIGVKVDGFFGKDMDKAVRQFQKQKNLTVDGIVGAGTQKALGL